MTSTKEDLKHARAAEASANKKVKNLEKKVQQAESRRVKEQVEVELLLKPLRDENEKLEKANDMLRELITDERQIAYNASIDILKDTLNESSFKLVMRCIGFVIEAGEKHEQLSRKLTKALENADMAHSAVCDENVELKKLWLNLKS